MTSFHFRTSIRLVVAGEHLGDRPSVEFGRPGSRVGSSRSNTVAEPGSVERRGRAARACSVCSAAWRRTSTCWIIHGFGSMMLCSTKTSATSSTASRTSSRAVAKVQMSSRSIGVMKVVFSRRITSWVISSPSCSRSWNFRAAPSAQRPDTPPPGHEGGRRLRGCSPRSSRTARRTHPCAARSSSLIDDSFRREVGCRPVARGISSTANKTNHMSERAAMDRLTHRYFSGVGVSRSRHAAVIARKNHQSPREAHRTNSLKGK